ncbi:MAG: ribosome silencing factor [Peptococcaceae bacterium]|nr:ribosome silencing factor [Peptococcaceae bacterium]
MPIDRKTLEKVVNFVEEKKGRDMMLLDLRGISVITDYFLLVTGNSRIQTRAIADYLQEKLGVWDIRLLRTEGLAEANWVLMDCGDLVIHIMTPETRDFYNLERLWGDAPVVAAGNSRFEGSSLAD